ncbi:MAG TPA: hypothetical protein VLV78_08380 [Thermoanaerobaculia bacterium]|nr:hypothetical protein [Thermoanaerobaculia bacterium]
MTPLLLLHVSAAIVSLLSGFMAMAFRKGSGLHGAAGTVFFISMLCMSGAGAYSAAFVKPNTGNVMGGALTLYLVATGWVTARRRDRTTGSFDLSALLAALAIGTLGASWGFEAVRSQTGLKDGYPPALYFVWCSIALLFAASDVRMIVRGGVSGPQRIARHLWRMCLALLIATLSFYPGQAKLFPKSLRATNLLYVPAVLLIGATLLWLHRIPARKRLERHPAMVVAHRPAPVTTWPAPQEWSE